MKVISTPGHHRWMIELDPRWIFVENVAEADCIWGPMGHIPTNMVIRPDQIILDAFLFHMGHSHNEQYFLNHISRPDHKKTLRILNNLALKQSKSLLVYHDTMFDREKLYCTDYDRSDKFLIPLHISVWTPACNKKMYELHPIKKTKIKKFLNMGRTRRPDDLRDSRILPRQRIQQILMSDKTDTFNMAYSSDPPYSIFFPNNATADICAHVQMGGWYPASNLYYDTSIISAYGETIVESYDGQIKLISEKTLDPLIQGNFILPFGYCGLIQDILSYGFKLPDWIDYSYDAIVDLNARWEKYEQILRNLMTMQLDDMFRLCQRDMHILEHNRSIFFTREYSSSSLYDRVVAAIKHNDVVDWVAS